MKPRVPLPVVVLWIAFVVAFAGTLAILSAHSGHTEVQPTQPHHIHNPNWNWQIIPRVNAQIRSAKA